MRTSTISNICHSWNNLVQFAEERALNMFTDSVLLLTITKNRYITKILDSNMLDA